MTPPGHRCGLWVAALLPALLAVGLYFHYDLGRLLTLESLKSSRDRLLAQYRAVTDGATPGFVKVPRVPGKDRILGVTIVGAHAGDLLAEYVLAMKHGLGLNKIMGTVHAYPTFSEASRSVAGAWKRAYAPKRLLAWAKRFHAWERG